jgi:hypothetical protein
MHMLFLVVEGDYEIVSGKDTGKVGKIVNN